MNGKNIAHGRRVAMLWQRVGEPNTLAAITFITELAPANSRSESIQSSKVPARRRDFQDAFAPLSPNGLR